MKIPGRIPDFVAACDWHGLRGKRIGVPWNVITLLREDKSQQQQREIDTEVVAFRKASSTMTAAGATIVDADFARPKELWETDIRRPVVQAAFMNGIEKYLSELETNPSKAKTLSDLRNLTWHHAKGGWDIPPTTPQYGTKL